MDDSHSPRPDLIREMKMKTLTPMAVALAFVVTAPLAKADWKIVEKANPLGPGSAVDVLQDGKPVARLVSRRRPNQTVPACVRNGWRTRHQPGPRQGR